MDIQNINAFRMNNLDESLSEVLGILIRESDELWKCLAYNEKDALSKSITLSQKADLCNQDSDSKRLILKPFSSGDIITDEQVQVRMFQDNMRGFSATTGSIIFTFEIIVHNNLWLLSNQKVRPLIIIRELFNSLSERRLDTMIGQLSFEGEQLIKRHFNNDYIGYSFSLNIYSG